MNNKRLYFAYGSNMNPVRLRGRVKKEPKAFVAELDNFHLVFNKKSYKSTETYANIEVLPGGQVLGVVYELDDDDIGELDKAEGYPDHYDRKTYILRNTTDGKAFLAECYVANPSRVVKQVNVSDAYMQHLLQGAKNFEFPTEYINKMLAAAGKIEE